MFRRCTKLALSAIGLISISAMQLPEPAMQSCEAAKDKQRVIDLTHVLAPGIPDFHNDSNAFEYKLSFTIPKDGFADGHFSMPEHLGTHVDAPSHFDKNGKSIDMIPAEKLILPCVVIDARSEVSKDPDYLLSVDKIKAFEKKGAIPAGSAVLLWTNWSEKWNDPKAYRNVDDKKSMHFPGFSGDAAKYLVEQRHVGAIGIDTLSLDYGQSHDFPVHNYALLQDIFMVENLTNLSELPPRGATLICGALPIKNGTGSPARIFALVP